MTVREAHIDFDLKYQNVSKGKFKKFFTQEIDWFLNRELLLYIKNKVEAFKSLKGGINDTSSRLEEVGSLVRTIDLSIYLDALGREFCILPADFFTGLNERLYYYNCSDNYTFETQQESVWYACFAMDATKFVSPNLDFTIDVVIDLTAGGQSIETVFDLSSFYSADLLADYMFFVDQLISEEASFPDGFKGTIKFYWERYDDIYKPNNFIAVATSGIGTPNEIRLNYESGGTVTIAFTEKEFDAIKLNDVDTPTIIGKDCNLVSNELAYRINNNPYAKSDKHSPKLYVEADRLVLLPLKGDIQPKHLRLSYIKKPIFMNYDLERNCELGVRQNVHQVMDKIVSQSVAFISLLVSKPNFSNLLNNNKEND